MLGKIIQELFGFVDKILGEILFFLPDSPFLTFFQSFQGNQIFNSLNWFLPLNEMIVVGEAWLVAIGVFYTYQVVLRWIRAVGT